MRIAIKILKGLLVGLSAIFLVTIGIDAVDNYDNLNESIVGRIIFGEGQGPCEMNMIFIPTDTGGFCLDKYEASASSNCDYDRPGGLMDSQANLEKSGCQAESKPGAYPWTHISQNQAVRACAKAGKRLSTSKEWQTGALGTPDKISGWTDADCQVDKNWNIQPGLTGSGEKCVSYAGAFDMIGNVWEWVDGAVTDGVYKGRSLPEAGFVKEINEEDGLPSKTGQQGDDLYYNDYYWLKDKETRAIARGGYWNNQEEAGQYSLYIVLPPSTVGSGVGFRCAK